MKEQLHSYEYLYNLIQTRTGLNLDEHRRQDVANVADNILTTMQLSGAHSLSLALTLSPITHPLWQRLLRVVTVGETYFFRNLAQFNALRYHILPDLIFKRREAGRLQLRLWSAGCATGEEPYSLAILLREMLPDLAAWNITLLATDINATSIEQARRGIYRPWSFRSETPPEVQARWFTEVSEGFELSSAVRSMVTFAPLNLVSDEYPSLANGTTGMDLIICRNVTIYFEQTTTRRIVERFNRALIDDGWLVVGHAEPVASVYQDQGFAPRNFPDAVLYQKCPPAEEAPFPFPYQTPWTSMSSSAFSRPLPSTEPPFSNVSQAAQTSGSTTANTQPLSPPLASTASTPIRNSAQPIVPEAKPESSKIDEEDAWEQARRAADQGNHEGAMTWLTKMEQQDTMQPQVHYLRGLVRLQIDDQEGAIRSLRQAIYCDPTFALAHYTLGTLYRQRGDNALAARHWRIAQRAIAGLAPEQTLPFDNDVTVEMLQGLLGQHLKDLPTTPTENPYAYL